MISFKIKKKHYLILGLVFLLVNPNSLLASTLTDVSDFISTSWPGTGASHTITFKTAKAIPASGKIVITPDDSDLIVFNGFDYTDVDLATSTVVGSLYVDRTLSASSSTSTDGVTVIASSSSDSITINLNSSYGIDAGVYVKIELGSVATFGEVGDRYILNASTTGVYKMDIITSTASDETLDYINTLVVMVDPVSMTAGQPKLRANGTPSGFLTYGTSQTLMSLTTNYIADCRYSTASSTLYADMTDQFFTTGAFYHSVVLAGLANGQAYNYYVRCQDEFAVDDASDYAISFSVSTAPGDEGDEGGVPGPGGGGSGGGSGGGFGNDKGRGIGTLLPYPPLPGLPGVVFVGWGYSLSGVTVLKDGVDQGSVNANVTAEFTAFLPDLPQGVYTFGLWSEDSDGRRSITYSITFWLDEGTQSTVSDIFLPPTIELSKSTVIVGDSFEVFGQGVPESKVEAWFYPDKEGTVNDSEIVKREGTIKSDGSWSLFLSSSGLSAGKYKVKTRSIIESVSTSDFGHILDISVGGEEPVEGVCAGADLNRDGRVNITDFSILLYWWGTDNECADQNKDGTVDLIDFSIMMYFWTG